MKVFHKHVIFWILLENHIAGNKWLSAGAFCEKERYFDGAYQWVSYKGATRISDVVYDTLHKFGSIERKKFKARGGHDYYKYRLTDNFMSNLPEYYKKIARMFKETGAYKSYKSK